MTLLSTVIQYMIAVALLGKESNYFKSQHANRKRHISKETKTKSYRFTVFVPFHFYNEKHCMNRYKEESKNGKVICFAICRECARFASKKMTKKHTAIILPSI